MYEAPRKEQAERTLLDETNCRAAKHKVLIRLCFPIRGFPKPLQAVKGDSGKESHIWTFLHLVIRVSQSNPDACGRHVYHPHDDDLLCSFVWVQLIDAYCVCP
jgi:hypothetical protein